MAEKDLETDSNEVGEWIEVQNKNGEDNISICQVEQSGGSIKAFKLSV